MFRSISMVMLLVALVTFISMVSSAASSPEADFVKKTISSHKIVIFSKSYCPYVSFSAHVQSLFIRFAEKLDLG